MEPGGSLLHPYSKPDRCSPCPSFHVSKIHFNIILLSTPGSCKWYPSLRFPDQTPVCASPPYMLRTLPISLVIGSPDLVTHRKNLKAVLTEWVKKMVRIFTELYICKAKNKGTIWGIRDFGRYMQIYSAQVLVYSTNKTDLNGKKFPGM